MLSRKKRRKQERQDKKARKHERYKKLRGLSATEQSRIVTEERKIPEASPSKKKRHLSSKKRTQVEPLVEDKGIEKEKRELKKLEKLLSIKERKEEKQKKLPNAFIRDGLDYVLDFARYTNSESDDDISSIEGEEENKEEVSSEEEAEDYQSSMEEEEAEEIEEENISLGESSEGNGGVQKRKKVTFAPETFASSTSSSISAPSSSSPNVTKRIQGLMNKLNESNMQTMFSSMEELYRENSQREVTKCLCEVFLKSAIQPILIKDKFAMELVMLVTLLHQKIGSEVGFAISSQLVKKLDELLSSSPSYGKGKECDCLLLVISHLYNFKVVQCVLIYDIIRKLLDSLTERDLDLLVLILKTCGMEIRRNDSLALKDIILDIQTKARTLNEDNSRMKFLLQVVSAIRTNNVRKIPQHDPALLEHMKKVLRGFLSGSLNESQAINLSFSELLEASSKGGYWNTTKSSAGLPLTNSGATPVSGASPAVGDGKDDKWIISLSLEQQMNTDIRRTVFSVIMSSEDYVDAFEKLVKLHLKNIQEREIVFVIVHCSLQENPFNPFYGYLSQKLIKYKRDHQVTFQFCLWDHLKTLSSLTPTQRLNLQCLLSHLIRDRSLSLSVLRVVEYAGMSKVGIEFHKSLLVMIFSGLSDQQLTSLVCSVGENRKDFVKSLYHFIRKQLQEKNTTTAQNIFKRLEELLIETIEY